MILLRLYLLAGLVAHKVVWERLKRRPAPVPGHTPAAAVPVRTRLVKLVKVAVLAGILIQTVTPMYWLPLAVDPTLPAIIGAVIYSGGLALALAGRLQLGNNWSDIESAKVLSHQAVVNRGVYRYLRHPIYVGDLLLLFGLELALNSWLILGVAVLTPVVLARAIHEEGLLKANLAGYREYCKTSKRFIPFLV
jgi:protein-S-isoprenylcysteine O-methyltransferase Ste14